MENTSSNNRTLAAVMFTDMVGYTALMQQDEALARRKRDRHREVLEASHQKYDGRIIQYFGDGTLSIFSSSVNAVQCAVEIQAALREPVEVSLRIGIHAGDIVIEKDNIIGDAVNLASRIESFSVPGAVLISETVFKQIQNQTHLPAISMGQFHFKNVKEPTTLYALTHEGLYVPKPDELEGKGQRVESPKHNLPQQLTSFIGREQEIVEIITLVQKEKLLTLTGPGGTGKTRLVLKVAENLAGDFKDGVCWIPLASISDLDSVKLAMIKTLGLIQLPAVNSVELLINFLQKKELLLVLDNFEHMMEAASIVQALLRNCPALKVLITSRIVLNLQMEQEYPLRPLQVPVLNGNNQVERLQGYPSMDLFCQRAKAVKPNFYLDNRNVVDVVNICHRLDGLPLAIELAAARIKIFSPHALLMRLDRHLDLLRAENPDRPVRHHTLRQTISWSYQLLSEEERRLFSRLAVFSGGCYLEAVESVCCQDDLDEFAIVDQFFALVNKSLVSQEEDFNGEARFYLLETIRAFALEKLEKEEEPENIREAHALHFVAKAEEAQSHLTGSEQVYWFSFLERDLGNFREAFNWSINQRRYELAFRLGIALWRLWITRDMLQEGVNNAQRLLECPIEEDLRPLRAKIVGALIATYFSTGEFSKALPLCRENLAFWRQVGHEKEIANNLNHLGFALFHSGEKESAISYTNEALDLYKKHDDLRGQAVSYNNFGWGYIDCGDPQRAVPYWERSLQLRRQINDERGIGLALINLSRAQTKLGIFQEAEENLKKSLNLTKKNKDKIIYYWGVIHLAILYYEQDDIEKCAQLLQDHSDSFSKLDVVWRLGFSSFLDGLVAERLGNYKEADRLIFKGIQNFERNWVPYYLAACWFCRSKIASASGNWTLAWDYLKTSLEINQKHIKLLGLAENLELAGMLYIETGEPEKAGLLLVKAKQMRLELGTPVPPVLESDIQGAWVKLQEHFTPEKLEQLSEKVKAMSREEVLALV